MTGLSSRAAPSDPTQPTRPTVPTEPVGRAGQARHAPGWWAGVGRVVFALAALLSFAGNAISFHIGSWKGTDLPADAGFSGGFEAGWEHMVNQPTYFTFMANFLVGLTSLLLAIRPHRTSTLFHAVRIAAVVCIVITGVVFNLLLRDASPATTEEFVNDTIQHVITPILTPLVWLLFDPRGAVTWRRIGLASVIPLAWLAFTMVRGPLLDWYPYSIMDVPRMGYDGVAVYLGAILAFFFVLAAVMWVLDRLLPGVTSTPDVETRR